MALCGLRGPRFLGPNVYPEAPDGGWGWVVAAAFFLVEALTYGTIKIFGIFLQDLMEQFGETNSRVSWVVSICVFVMTFSGPLSAVMTNRFGFQLVVMTGGFLIATGNIATSFTTSINQMYITYGVVAGLGYCLTFLPTVTILSQYFTRRRSLVVAVASTGESLSMFALAPAFSALRDRVGWRHTMVVIGSLQTIIVICGALLRPIIIKPGSARETRTDRLSSKQLADVRTSEDAKAHLEDSTTNGASHPQNDPHGADDLLTRGSVVSAVNGVQALRGADSSSPEEKTLLQEEEARASVENATAGTTGSEAKQKESDGAQRGAADPPGNPKLLDFSVLGECSFILYSLFGLFATLGFFAPPLYVIELSVSRGVPRDTATYMLSAMAVAEILGRLSIGWILTRERFRRRKLQVLLVCVVGMTADLFGFTLASEFYGLAACCSFFGFFMGSISCSHIPMLAEDDVVGIERMPSAAGVYVFIQSFAGLAGPPLGGVLVDATQNYGSAFYSCAAGMALGALFLALVRPAKNRLLCRSGQSKRPEDQRGGRGDSECSA